jgi:hypothetical protein
MLAARIPRRFMQSTCVHDIMVEETGNVDGNFICSNLSVHKSLAMLLNTACTFHGFL